MDDSTVRLMMTLKVNSLSRGYSGIRLEVIAFFMQLLCSEVYPCVPQKGSVGASGDLAPLAHMCLPLLGEGNMRHKGEIISAAQGLKIANLSPLTLGAKEGLALLNGTQASTAFALQGLFQAEDLSADLEQQTKDIFAAQGFDVEDEETMEAIAEKYAADPKRLIDEMISIPFSFWYK